MPSSMSATSQPTTMVVGAVPPSASRVAEHGRRIHAVRFETGRGRQCFVVGLEDVQRARRAAIGQRVDEHQRVPTLQ